MSTYENVKLGRSYTVSIENGEDIIECVNDVLEKEKVKNAVFVAGVGSVDNCVSHVAIWDESLNSYMDIPVVWENHPLELCGIQGFIENGKPHLHGMVGDENESFTVHIHPGCICLQSFKITFIELI